MQTIRELLNKIKWDPREDRSDYIIGYFDRVENTLRKIPLTELREIDTSDFSFSIRDKQGHSHQVPFHRIKKVWKNKKCVWKREIDPAYSQQSFKKKKICI